MGTVGCVRIVVKYKGGCDGRRKNHSAHKGSVQQAGR